MERGLTMSRLTWLSAAAALAAALPGLETGAAAACTATIQASSDTPIAAGSTFNVGQQAIFTVTGATPVSYAWSVSGQVNIKDYNEDLGTRLSTTPPATPTAWLETPLVAADMTQPTLSLYWKPSAAQIHPNNASEVRTVTLNYSDGVNPCTATLNVTVERNTTDETRQAEDFYTSNHREPTTTEPGQGRVIDEHQYWHVAGVGGMGATDDWWRFLAWHGYFLRRFDEWREAFGYPSVVAWHPGRRVPMGAEFDNHNATLRNPGFDPDTSRIPWHLTLAGTPPGGSPSISTPADLDAFSGSLNGYHSQIHCTLGSGGGFGNMCDFSSPKDPLFWRWHGFIDILYRNYCAVKGLTTCHSPAGLAADPWIGDNAADIAANGVPPSPGIHYLSPDIWNRRNEVLSATCLPGTIPTPLNTVGGVLRDCGTELQHENPVAGQTNYLYATLRNTGASAVRNVYAEVVVYIANASTGLSWPTDFTMLPESRQFITIHLEPNQVTAIGPLPWTPPSPSPSDHWCIYIRILSVQEAPLVEGPVVDTNVANSNSIAWRNLKVVNPGERMMSRFIVRNIRREGEALALDLAVPPELLRAGRVVLALDPALQRAAGGQPEVRGGRLVERGRIQITEPRAVIAGLRLPPRGQGVAEIQIDGNARTPTGDIVVTQRSGRGVDGGVTVRVAPRRRRAYH